MVSQEHFSLTRQGYEDLERELKALEQEYRESFEEFVDVNVSNDPTPDEGAYFEARTRKEFVEQQIDYLRDVLKRAQIIEEDPDLKTVDPGDRVTVWDFEQNNETVFDLVGDSPEVIYGREGISIESPVGQALLGRLVGDVIQVETPDGKVRYCIRKIERIPPNGN